MTAINVLQSSDAIYMMTDGASYLPDGTLCAYSQKVFPIAHLSAVIAARGPHLFLPLVASALEGEFTTFDALVAGLARVVRAATVMHEHVFRLCAIGDDFDLVVAGWSESTGQPAAYILTSKPREGVEAWWTLPLGPFAAMPWDAATEARVEISLTEEERRGEFSDPMGFLLRVCEAQRFAMDIQGGEGGPSHGVGGFAQVTQITPAGITTGVLKRWNDPLGEKLDPFRDAA